MHSQLIQMTLACSSCIEVPLFASALLLTALTIRQQLKKRAKNQMSLAQRAKANKYHPCGACFLAIYGEPHYYQGSYREDDSPWDSTAAVVLGLKPCSEIDTTFLKPGKGTQRLLQNCPQTHARVWYKLTLQAIRLGKLYVTKVNNFAPYPGGSTIISTRPRDAAIIQKAFDSCRNQRLEGKTGERFHTTLGRIFGYPKTAIQEFVQRSC